MSSNGEDNDISLKMNLYLQTLDEKEMKTYEIAKSFLGSTFQLEKSNGFLQWLATPATTQSSSSSIPSEELNK